MQALAEAGDPIWPQLPSDSVFHGSHETTPEVNLGTIMRL